MNTCLFSILLATATFAQAQQPPPAFDPTVLAQFPSNWDIMFPKAVQVEIPAAGSGKKTVKTYCGLKYLIGGDGFKADKTSAYESKIDVRLLVTSDESLLTPASDSTESGIVTTLMKSLSEVGRRTVIEALTPLLQSLEPKKITDRDPLWLLEDARGRVRAYVAEVNAVLAVTAEQTVRDYIRRELQYVGSVAVKAADRPAIHDFAALPDQLKKARAQLSADMQVLANAAAWTNTEKWFDGFNRQMLPTLRARLKSPEAIALTDEVIQGKKTTAELGSFAQKQRDKLRDATVIIHALRSGSNPEIMQLQAETILNHWAKP
ncbi:MAG: hypothetical protein IAE77_05305 [Prosthecobacter sp.]|uniref:hypothetical protein n=1 Tax=Prosthecobacter sp. TaxID=1965333 RepID=UPI001A018900|nr:hypothetical protein [Prosthecobacter sp.]MBE2282860.1 hypothetical protein [Prosthecobacter sp.]